MNALRFALRSMLWWLNIAAASFCDFPGRCWNVRWGWKRQCRYQFDDLSCQLRCRDTGANEAKHGTAPVASGTDALESVGLVAGENVIGADARTMARRARGRVGRLASIRNDVSASNMHPVPFSRRDPVERAVAMDPRPGLVELAIDARATGDSRTGLLPIGIDEIGMFRAGSHTHVRVRARDIGMDLSVLGYAADLDLVVARLGCPDPGSDKGMVNMKTPHRLIGPGDRDIDSGRRRRDRRGRHVNSAAR